MVKFTCEIDLSSESMSTGNAVAEALSQIAQTLATFDTPNPSIFTGGIVNDENGVKVGGWRMAEKRKYQPRKSTAK